MARLLLSLVALASAVSGVLFLISPERMAGTLTLVVLTPVARTEIMATYGGLPLGVAAFLAHCAVYRAYTLAGLLASGTLLCGAGFFRAFGAATNGGTEPLMWQLAAAEILFGVLSLLLWMREGSAGGRAIRSSP